MPLSVNPLYDEPGLRSMAEIQRRKGAFGSERGSASDRLSSVDSHTLKPSVAHNDHMYNTLSHEKSSAASNPYASLDSGSSHTQPAHHQPSYGTLNHGQPNYDSLNRNTALADYDTLNRNQGHPNYDTLNRNTAQTDYDHLHDHRPASHPNYERIDVDAPDSYGHLQTNSRGLAAGANYQHLNLAPMHTSTEYDHIDRPLNIMAGSAYAQPSIQAEPSTYAQPSAAFNLDQHAYAAMGSPAQRAWIDDEDNV